MKSVARTILIALVLAVSASAYAVDSLPQTPSVNHTQDQYSQHLVASQTFGNITVLAATPLAAENTMRLFRNELDRIRREVLSDETLDLTLPITICVWENDALYRAQVAVAQDLGNACSFQAETKKTRRHEIHLSPSMAENQTVDEAILNMLPHEICHILQHEQFLKDQLNETQAKPKKRLKKSRKIKNYPLALAEGLAVLSEHSVQDARIRLTAEAFAQASVNPISSLLQIKHYHQVPNLSLFYARSYSFTEFLQSRMNQAQFAQFLQLIRDGNSVQKSFGITRGFKTTKAATKALNFRWRQYALLQAKLLAEIEKRKEKHS